MCFAQSCDAEMLATRISSALCQQSVCVHTICNIILLSICKFSLCSALCSPVNFEPFASLTSKQKLSKNKKFNPSKIDRIRSRPIYLVGARGTHEDLKDLPREDGHVFLRQKGKYTRILCMTSIYQSLRSRPTELNRLSASVRGVEVVILPKRLKLFYVYIVDTSQKSSQQPIDKKHQALTGSTEHDVNEFISHSDLLPFFQMLHLTVAANVTPTKFKKKIKIDVQGKFLLQIIRGVDIDLPCHIIKTIKREANAKSSKNGLPFGLLITGLSLEAGVKPGSREKEVQSPVDPICLIYKPIQNGPLACTSTLEAATGTASSSQTLAPFDDILLEIG